MNARIIKYWQDLQGSYYFVPGMMVLSSIILAIVTINIDLRLPNELARKLGWFYANDADSARTILSTIAAAMMSVTAVTFSITMVAVTTASGQYGPRLIGNFMRDRANQFTLGAFLSNFVFALMILRVTRSETVGELPELVPNVSLLIAFLMTLISVGVMIFFIHHIPETLNVGNILARVGHRLRDDVDEVFPANLSEPAKKIEVNRDDYKTENAHAVCAKFEGYIQTLNETQILRIAVEFDLVIEVIKTPGDFVILGDTLILFWQNESAPNNQVEDIDNALQNTFAMGRQRTAHQNLLFLADELVEILARALSPGVNDPFTAKNCIYWYKSALSAMMKGQAVEPLRQDGDGNLRIITRSLQIEDFTDSLLGQSRPYIATDFNVTLLMLDVLSDLIAQSDNQSAKAILTKEGMDLFNHAIKHHTNKAQKERLELRLKAFAKT